MATGRGGVSLQLLTCCWCLQAELLLHVERLVQSVKALCSSLAAVESPEVTAALSQLPACPCRLQPRVLKVTCWARRSCDLRVLASLLLGWP